jgi:hypothetical protein
MHVPRDSLTAHHCACYAMPSAGGMAADEQILNGSTETVTIVHKLARRRS